MQLRDAAERDYEGICALVPSAEELYFVYPRGNFPFTVEQIRTLAEVRKDLTVAEDGQRIVGFANLYDYEPGHWIFIGNVVVAQDYRGRGLGRRLVEHMRDLALSKYTLPEIRISVFSHNIPAMLLYASCGFMPYAIEERNDFTGRRVALVHMKTHE